MTETVTKLVTDRVIWKSNAIDRVRLSVRLFLLSLKPTDLWHTDLGT